MIPPPVVNESKLQLAPQPLRKTDDALLAIRKRNPDWQRFSFPAGYSGCTTFGGDLWCAAFVVAQQVGDLEGNAPTWELWFRTVLKPAKYPAFTKQEVGNIARQYRFFHWHLAFPHVFETGGLMLMLGNPPGYTEPRMRRSSFQHTEPPVFEVQSEARARGHDRRTGLRLLRYQRRGCESKNAVATAFFSLESGRYSTVCAGEPR